MNIVADFTQRAQRAGASVHSVEDIAAAGLLVADQLRALGVRSVLVAPDLEEWLDPIVTALRAAGMTVHLDATPSDMGEIGAGVSRVPLAIAETGSLLVVGNELVPRLATMLPRIHIALAEESSIVRSLDNAARYLRQAVLHLQPEGIHYASFVTGPSRTADIEQRLTLGVQGPRELLVVLIGTRLT